MGPFADYRLEGSRIVFTRTEADPHRQPHTPLARHVEPAQQAQGSGGKGTGAGEFSGGDDHALLRHELA